METSQSPWKVIREAHRLACRIWPAHTHRFSRHEFTLPQLFACLVLKTFLKTDYRGLVEHLADHSDLC